MVPVMMPGLVKGTSEVMEEEVLLPVCDPSLPVAPSLFPLSLQTPGMLAWLSEPLVLHLPFGFGYFVWLALEALVWFSSILVQVLFGTFLVWLVTLCTIEVYSIFTNIFGFLSRIQKK